MFGAIPVASNPKAFGSFDRALIFLISSGVNFYAKSIFNSVIPVAIKAVSKQPLVLDFIVVTVL